MFASQGWKDLIEDLEKDLQNIDNLNGISDEKQLHSRLGQKTVLERILSRETMIREAYEDNS